MCYEELQRISKLIMRNCINCDLNRDGTALNRLVLRKNEIEKVFLECHLTAGGYKGRDAILFRRFENVITGPVTTSRLKRRLGLM